MTRPFAQRAVRDHADVDSGDLADHAREQRPAQDLGATPLVRSADEDVRRPALFGDAANRFDEVVTVLFEEMDAEHSRNSAERRQLCCLLPGRLASRGAHPQRVDLGAETLRGTPRTPEDSLRLRLGLDQGQDPFGDRLLGQRLERVGMPSRSTSSATSRSTSSRRAARLSCRKKFCRATSALSFG